MSMQFIVMAAGASLASLALACTSTTKRRSLEDETQQLVKDSEHANDALMRGDVDRYQELVRLSEDFTLFSPFGGKPTHGNDQTRMDRMRTFFKNGSLTQEVVQTYASADMVVLAVIERGRVEVGGLPSQDWGLRVTLVYRRQDNGWRLVHRHADPLAAGISLGHAAVLGRGTQL